MRVVADAIVFVLACLACIGYGRRSQTRSIEKTHAEPNRALATSLLASHPVLRSLESASALRTPSSNRAAPRPHVVMEMKPSDDSHDKGSRSRLAKPVSVRRPALASGLLGAAFASFAKAAFAAGGGPWSTKDFFDAVNGNKVEKVSFSEDGTKLTSIDSDGSRHETLILPEQVSEVTRLLQSKDIVFAVVPKENSGGDIPSAIGGVLINAFLILVPFFISTRAQGMNPGGPPGGAGKSRSKIQMEPNTGVTFVDVAGCDGAKLELNEVVDFLKNPAKYSALGAKIPKGVIMEGPPGTGKTLLARAVAGEAGVPFISASGSEFVEMFVGVGASRVRDLFGQAKKNAPCIVFIDEIDAIGRQRAAGGGGGMGGGGNDEREQTLNQILTEMDGFEGNTGVIVLAATNRADVLDNALIRPGRFDRRVPVDLPDVKGRREILNVHIRGKPLSAEIDLNVIAKRTTGFSGASLANLMNEAAIIAARNGKTEIGYDEVDYAIDRIQVGMQKQTGMSFPTRQKLVAYHEAGHAIMGLVLPEYDMVTKVTIIPRTSGAGGFTLFTPTEERMESGMYSKKYLCSQLAVALGGRVAEELIYGKDEITTGASNDLQQVRNIARRMVAQWGFANEAMGAAPVAWEGESGNSLRTSNAASLDTERQIDEQVKILVNCAYQTAKNALSANREFLDKMADVLVEKETIDYKELLEMREKYASEGTIEPMMPKQPQLA